MECVACSKKFKRKSGSTRCNRWRLNHIVDPYTRGKVFPSLKKVVSPHCEQFLCAICYATLKDCTVSVAPRSRRRRYVSPERENIVMQDTTSHEKDTYHGTALNYLEHYKYKKLFLHLCSTSESAKKALMEVCSDIVSEERKSYEKDSNMFKQEVDLQTIESFSWDSCVKEVKDRCPSLYILLNGLLPVIGNIQNQHFHGYGIHRRKMTTNEAQLWLHRRQGIIMAIVLNTWNPFTHCFVQGCTSISLWRQGASLKLHGAFNTLGLAKSVTSARKIVDKLRGFHNQEILEWKAQLETRASPKEIQSYSFCWDNVQIDTVAKHQLVNGNKFFLWGMCFATNNRAKSLHLNEDGRRLASNLPASSFLPVQSDFSQLRCRMMIIVQRILVVHLETLKELRHHINWHIEHDQSETMRQPSQVVNLGVIEANTASTGGTLKVMEHLHKFVPKKDGLVVPLLTNGDGLSIERMIHAHRARKNHDTPDNRLEGLVESPQEFHKEILLLQDTMNAFFSIKSQGSRGTLYHLKTFFRHKNLKKNVMENFQHVWDMVQFSTEAHVSLLSMVLEGMDSIDSVPTSYPTDATTAEKLKWLQQLSEKVVDFCWQPYQQEDIDTIASAMKNGEVRRCCDDNGDRGPLIRCQSNQCELRFIHVECADLNDPPGPDEEFFCSESCRTSGSYIYCFCKKNLGGLMLQCSRASKCIRNEWYHTSCLRMSGDIPDEWFCSDECALGSLNDDLVLNHTKALMHEGLFHLAQRDAVREGDGPAMLSHWKMNLIQFYQLNHYKYVIIAHYLLASAHGFQPERIRYDLIWNRVANIRGIHGGNIGLDLVNEHLNNDFKAMLKRSKGHLTEEQVARCAEFGGAFGQHIDSLFTSVGLGEFSAKERFDHKNWHHDQVRTFTEEFKNDALFDYIPPRHHMGLEHLCFDKVIKSPELFARKLTNLSDTMDRWERIRPQ